MPVCRTSARSEYLRRDRPRRKGCVWEVSRDCISLSNMCFEIEIVRRKMEILLDHFNSLVSGNVLVPLNHCAQRTNFTKEDLV